MQHYHCLNCGQVIVKLIDKGNDLTCCKNNLELLEPKLVEAEDLVHDIHIRHVGNFLNVNLQTHPMLETHKIEFISVKTNNNYQLKQLTIYDKPEALFVIDFEEVIEEVFVYCNIHGLIKAELVT